MSESNKPSRIEGLAEDNEELTEEEHEARCKVSDAVVAAVMNEGTDAGIALEGGIIGLVCSAIAIDCDLETLIAGITKAYEWSYEHEKAKAN